MKKLFLILSAAVVLSSCAWAKDLSKDKCMRYEHSWAGTSYITPEKIVVICWEDETYTEDDRGSFRLDENGWFYYDETMCIPGLTAVRLGGNCKTDEYAQKQGYFFNPWFGAKYSATSALSENTRSGFVTYASENLGTFAFAPTSHYESLSWNYEHIPYAEGEKGYGIGTVIKMTTEKPFQRIMILNGYVDAKKPDLYRKNSRVKAFSVCDLDNGGEYTFELEDCVCFQFFNLSGETKNIELKIAEVYKGDRWDDTCVSAIVPTMPGVTASAPPYQKYTCFGDKEAVLKAIGWYTSEYKPYKYEPDRDK